MAEAPNTPANAREQQYWNSAATWAWADQHARIDRLFANITAIAMETAAAEPGDRALDIGCGSGTTVLELAQRVGAGGRVLGVDISEHSVALAASGSRRRASPRRGSSSPMHRSTASSRAGSISPSRASA